MSRHYFITYLVSLAMLLYFSAAAFGAEEILIGLIPEENIFTQMDRHRPLAAYLTMKLGIKVRFTILSRYGDVLDRFMSRKMDGAFFGVFTSALAMGQLDAEPLVHPVNLDGSSTVQSYIFVRKDSNISRVGEMKGKRMAFVDKATVTGYLYAFSFFREQGAEDLQTYFREVSFTGSHGSAIYSVLDRRADIGTAKSKIFDRLVKKEPGIKEELVIIARSPELPDTTLFLRKDFSRDRRFQIREALLGMDKDAEGLEVLKRLETQKFIEANKSDFRPFFEIAQKAGINVKTYKYK